MKRFPSGIARASFAVLSALAIDSMAGSASADESIIKHPGDHPDYFFEAEPHAIFTPIEPPGGHMKGGAFGAGFRGTFKLVDNGFISSINNSIGLGVGGDFFFGNKAVIWVPIVMQWNFWISRNWSVFGEPGGGIFFGDKTAPRPAFYGGARFHFVDRVTLTLRAGYPNFSAGISFLL